MEPVERAWVSTGHQVKIEEGLIGRIPDYDRRSGDHFWTVATTYQVNPANFRDPSATPMLDQENLVMVAGPFCYHCEKPYRPGMELRRCPGEPRSRR